MMDDGSFIIHYVMSYVVNNVLQGTLLIYLLYHIKVVIAHREYL